MNGVAWVLWILTVAAILVAAITQDAWPWILALILLVAVFLTELRIAWIKVRAMEKGDDPL